MNEEARILLIEKMADNLVVMRAKLGVTQEELAGMAGLSRQTILALEKKQRMMTWNTFLSLLYIFSVNDATQPLLTTFGILTDDFKKYITITKK